MRRVSHSRNCFMLQHFPEQNALYFSLVLSVSTLKNVASSVLQSRYIVLALLSLSIVTENVGNNFSKHFSANKRCSTVELVRQKVIHQNVIIFPLQSGDNFRRSAASRCSNDEVRKSSLPSEICVNRTDNYSSMNSTSRSTTRERVIPIEIKDATSDHLFTEGIQSNFSHIAICIRKSKCR